MKLDKLTARDVNIIIYTDYETIIRIEHKLTGDVNRFYYRETTNEHGTSFDGLLEAIEDPMCHAYQLETYCAEAVIWQNELLGHEAKNAIYL